MLEVAHFVLDFWIYLTAHRGTEQVDKMDKLLDKFG